MFYNKLNGGQESYDEYFSDLWWCAEHDVSIHSATSFISGVDFATHTVTLIYITKEGQWLKGPKLETNDNMSGNSLYLNSEEGFKGEETNFRS